MADLQLSQETCNQLSNQMNEMVKTRKLLKIAVQGTYKTFRNVQKQYPRNLPTHKENCNKIRKSSHIC